MSKVRLKKFTRCNGNAYHIGTYDREYLPPQILNTPGLVAELDEKPSITPNYKENLKAETVTMGTSSPAQKNTTYTTPENVDLDKEEAKSNTESVSKLDINKSTVDELSGVDGVTVSTAKSIVDQREKNPFKDYADLDKRLPLRGKKKWESLSDRIEIK